MSMTANAKIRIEGQTVHYPEMRRNGRGVYFIFSKKFGTIDKG
jgi:hypothetical protein